MSMPTVFVLNASHDVVELLRLALENGGFSVATGFIDDLQRGQLNLPQQFELHRPSAIVFDISMPYQRRWTVLEQLRSNPISDGIPFVLTSTNVRRLREAVDTDEPIVEIAGEEEDLDEVVAAVRKVTGGDDDTQ